MRTRTGAAIGSLVRRPLLVLLAAALVLLYPACCRVPEPGPGTIVPDRELDLLIVADQAFLGTLQALRIHKEATGVRTHLVAWQSLVAAFDQDGRDEPERIKRALVAFDQQTGVRYVMLVGDSDALPVRYCLARNTEWGDKYYPSDLYYADLYGAGGGFDDWDGNGNGVFCEMDFTGGTDIDLVNLDGIHMLPDLMVGRVPASTAAEVATYADKVIAYEGATGEPAWTGRALLVVDGGPGAFGDEAKMDALADALVDFTALKRYQDDAPYATMTPQQRAAVLSQDLDQGVDLAFYHGHGNRLSWAGWYGAADVAGLTNGARLPIVFAAACYTGRFHFDREYYLTDAGSEWNRLAGPWPATAYPLPASVQAAAYDAHDGESFAERFLVRGDAGAIAYVGSVSKVEHGVWFAPERGLAHYFAQGYEAGTTVGAMWNHALATFIEGEVVPEAMGWYRYIHIHKMMLFGDPSLRVGRVAAAGITVFPPDALLDTLAEVELTATVTGTADTSVTWSATGGTISGSGATIVYTAPGTPGAQQVTATSVALPGLSASADITVVIPTERERDAEDPSGIVHAAEIEDARVVRHYRAGIRDDAYSSDPFDAKDTGEDPTEREPQKVHPLLLRWLEERGPDARERIVITFPEVLTIPRFPEPFEEEPRDSAANQALLRQVEDLIAQIRGEREQSYDAWGDELARMYAGEVIESFWLIHAMQIEIPLGAVPQLAERPDVWSLEPERSEDYPPQNANPGDDVIVARGLIVTDPYYALGLTGGWIGLLDTGVRGTHTQFASPSNLDFRRDCVNGTGGNCTTPAASQNPNDDCWNHGTSSAGIISGNANSGARFRGVTGITLDSFKVYPNTTNDAGFCNGGLSTSAAVRGFEAAVAVLDRVIVAEMQGGGGVTGALSSAADQAFDSGAVIIAANGNNGSAAGTVNAPANAHKALGVGNFDVQTQAQIASQSRGPTSDNRYKPDIQAPTNTETAGNGCPFGHGTTCTTFSDTALTVFGGTSGATPYAAGAAALLRNWLRGTSFSIDPGQVYAQMILSGQNPYPFDNTRGAGPIRLPVNGHAWWGKITVLDGQTIDIPIHVGGAAPAVFDGALWWPETATQQHNDVDLYLIDPSGALRAFSISGPSVFERARVEGSLATGTWTLRIRGYDVRSGSQTVYWAAAAMR